MNKKIFLLVNIIVFIFSLSNCKKEIQNLNQEFTISYYSEYDTIPNNKIVEAGYKIKDTDLPTLLNLDNFFDGWYQNNKKIKPGFIVNENIILEAKWKPYLIYNFDKDIFNGKSIETQGELSIEDWMNPENGNLYINGIEISKTSEIVAIPKGTIARICITKNNSNSLIFQTNRKIELNSFAISQYQVTRKLYKTIMKNDPSNAKSNGILEDNPVNNINWFDAIIFCNKLSIENHLNCVYSYVLNNQKSTNPDEWLTNIGPVPYTENDLNYNAWKNNLNIDLTANGYRLPTEIEWEFCARGGNPNIYDKEHYLIWDYIYSGSNNYLDVAWCDNFSNFEGTKEVGLNILSNRINIFDMNGNVWECCNDFYYENINDNELIVNNDGFIINLLIDTPSTYIVQRGGSWGNKKDYCETSKRSFSKPYLRDAGYGIRLVRTTLMEY